MAENKNIEVGGRLHSIASGNVLAGADEIFDDAKNKKQSVINAEVDSILSTHSSVIAGLNTQNYVTVTATEETMDVTDVLPSEDQATDTVYRVGCWNGTEFDESSYSEYAWNGSAYVHVSTKTQISEVFDISAYHASGGELATYDDLTDALDGGNNIPQSLRKGGMEIRFVQTSDNKYVQFRYMSSSTDVADFTNVDNWQKQGAEVTISPNSQLGGYDINIGGDSTNVAPQTMMNMSDGALYNEFPIETGAISNTTGKDYDLARRCRTKNYLHTPFNITTKDGYIIKSAYRYSKYDLSFVDYIAIESSIASITNNNYIYRITFAKSDNTDFDGETYDDIINGFNGIIGIITQNISTNERQIESNNKDTFGVKLSGTGNNDTIVDLAVNYQVVIGKTYAVKIKALDDSGVTDGKNIFFIQNADYSQTLASIVKGSGVTYLTFMPDVNVINIRCRATVSTDVGVIFGGLDIEVKNNTQRIQNLESNVNSVKTSVNGLSNTVDGLLVDGTGAGDSPVTLLQASTIAGKKYFIKIKTLDDSGVGNGKNKLFVQNSDYQQTILGVPKGDTDTLFSFVAIDSTSYIRCRATNGTKVEILYDGLKYHVNDNTEEIESLNLHVSGKEVKGTGVGDSPVTLYSADTVAGHQYLLKIISLNGTGITDGKNVLYVQDKTHQTTLAAVQKGVSAQFVAFTAINEISHIKCRATNGTTVKLIYGGLEISIDERFDNISKQISIDNLDKLPSLSDIIQPSFALSFARIITDWGFVGASYDSGVFEDYSTNPVSYVTDYSKSVWQIFCSINNVQGYNFSVGGQTAKGWCTNQNERAWYGAQSSPKKGYTIQLGGNDLTNYDKGDIGSYPVGDPSTDIDFADWNNNADTYCGWIAGVIQRIKSIAPLAPIFMLSINNRLSGSHDVVGWNAALQTVISMCNTQFGQVYYVDQFGYPDWRNAEVARRYLVGGHPNFAGYVYLAGMFNKLIDNTIRDNIYEFRLIQFN
ncbi:MAG: hypothetical protein J6Y28_09700 [Acholeplasmatales bacterium]|nr:hypothetical protein [Methanobrevibacter sp.]MBP5446432.1 hypothetical protein [Acholeplasmatales bacterium]